MTMHSTERVRGVAERFDLPGRVGEIRPYGTGLINETFLVVTDAGTKAILQRINESVFPDPERVQFNLRQLLDHAERKSAGAGPTLQLPRIVCARDGLDFAWTAGGFWRMSSFIQRSRSFDVLADESQAREVGVALGRFHVLVSDLEPDLLHDTLPGFHVTPGYLERFDRVLSASSEGSVDAALQANLDFIDGRRSGVAVLEEARHQGVLRTRVIHGDPKLNNVLFDIENGVALSLIDLDTVKPGLIHYDLGDCLRSCCNRSGEAGRDSDDVRFDPDICGAVLAGYFAEASAAVTDQDVALLFDAIRLIPFELGLRFLTDHLQGNVYFKVTERDQNFQRASVQFQLVRSIEQQEQTIRRLCERTFADHRRKDDD